MAYNKSRKSPRKAEPPKTWESHEFLSFEPNAQQAEIIAAVRNRSANGRVLALAGVGKTTLFRMITEDPANRNVRFLYLAFNRGVADAAEAVFPPNCDCLNYHRIAFNYMRDQAWKRNGKYPSGEYVATVLNIKPFKYENDEGDSVTVDTERIGYTVQEAIGNFCTTDDYRVSEWHVKRTLIVKRIPEAHRERFIAHVLPYVQAAWSDIANPNGVLPYMPGRGDGCYVKLWSLANPTIRSLKDRQNYDVILYDEAQDANPPVSRVVSKQDCQKIYVGDSNQAIYGFTGAVDALAKFEADWTLPLTQSFRFGLAIAEAGNSILRHIPDNTLELQGLDSIESEETELTAPDCVLCRTNAGVIESALEAVAEGHNVAIAGGTAEIERFATEAEKLIDPDSAYRRHSAKQAANGKGAVPREKYLKVGQPQLRIFSSWEAVRNAVDEGDASDIAMLVRIIDKYGVEKIFEVCENSTKLRKGESPTEWASKPGNVMVSTAHKAKGLEWNSVKIHPDFQPPKEGKTLAVSELMLIYVAVTRAKRQLDRRALAWVDDLAAEMLNGGESGLGQLG